MMYKIPTTVNIHLFVIDLARQLSTPIKRQIGRNNLAIIIPKGHKSARCKNCETEIF